jgi:hypothetical protein
VLLIDEKAYGFYYTQNGYKQSKQNFERNGSAFNYPCITNVSFDDNYLCVKMSRVYGVTYHDQCHDAIVIKKLLLMETLSDSKRDKEGNLLFLQHGDANRANIIWTGESDFVFIDLDNISYYPPLLDVFHYLCMAGYDLDGIVDLLNQNHALLKEVCIKSEINYMDNPLDTLFYRYVLHYLRNVGGCYEDFRFLSRENTLLYPKTNKLL